MLFAPYICFHIFNQLGNRVTAYWEIAAHLAYDMFSWYKYLIVNLVFSHLRFWSVNFFRMAPFPDHCLLLSSYS